MKKFFIKLLLFLIPVGLICGYAAFRADGSIDPFYIRFTTPPQKSLILGTSRAAQGIMPSVLNSNLNDSFFNFAFTIAHSPYGPSYYDAIFNKLDPASKNGTFILSVDPWSIAAKGDPEDPEHFPEKNTFIGKMHLFNLCPNVEYLVRHYDKPFARLAFYKEKQDYSFLHRDGWLEINVPMDNVAVEERSTSKLQEYSNYITQYKFSKLRFDYLQKTIKRLKEHGSVVLVRLPIPKEMMQIENKLMPSFDSMINTASKAYSVPYYNMTNIPQQFQYTDANHLYSESSRKVSVMIAEFISNAQGSVRP